MDNLAIRPAPQPAANISAAGPANNPLDSEDSSSVSEDTDWYSEESDEDNAEDSDESEMDSLADEEYWEEDQAADAWLARNPGGTPLLYPQLFIPKPFGGKGFHSHSNAANGTHTFLSLPPEIRFQIFEYYFDRGEDVKRPEEEYAPFLDRNGKVLQRIRLSSEDVELKFWLSTALLQTSQQLRFEAMSVLFMNRVITVEWLLVLPRFVQFLGKTGCAMVRYLDIWDPLNFQGDQQVTYRYNIKSVSHFSCLQSLRIVLSLGTYPPWASADRERSFLDTIEWTEDGDLNSHGVPKIRSEDIESHWPEYGILKNLKVQKFILALESTLCSRIFEFDRTSGAYSEISESMQSHPPPSESISLPAPILTSSFLPRALEPLETMEVQLRGRSSTFSLELEDEDSVSLTWQETDHLTNKTIPLYNFFREFFHNNNYLQLEAPLDLISIRKFALFPTARSSTGGVMRDCAFCYLNEGHCGYHAVPDQPPFELKSLEGNSDEEKVETLMALWNDLSYVDMRGACRSVVAQIWSSEEHDLSKAFEVFSYLNGFETPISHVLSRLDAAVEAGWTGKRVDKTEVAPWDVLYNELHSERLKQVW